MEKLRVLIADSVAPVRNLVKYSLENNYKSIEIDEVSNGSDAQSRLGKKKYDLVLCDWEMPVIGGDELLVWVRKQPDLKTLPFIMLTGNRDKECVERAKEIGVSAYMLKPFTAEKLIQEITSVLDKSERRQFDRFSAEGTVILRGASYENKGTILDISIGGMLSLFPRKDQVPQILETVSLDLEIKGAGKVQEITGFILRLQAAEALINTQNIKIAIKFSDNLSPSRKEQLKNILTSMKQL